MNNLKSVDFSKNDNKLEQTYDPTQIASFMSKVYLWMFFALVITTITAYQVCKYPHIVDFVFQHTPVFWGILIFQLLLICILSANLHKVPIWLYEIIFLIFAISVGAIVSVIFLVFTINSIFISFLITAFSYVGLSAYGYLTKRDLGPLGSFCLMGLFGSVLFVPVTIFFPNIISNTGQIVVNVMGILVFAGLTAHDTQRIKQEYLHLNNNTIAEIKRAELRGALDLYLDFMNLFMKILSVLGKKK